MIKKNLNPMIACAERLLHYADKKILTSAGDQVMSLGNDRLTLED